MKKFLSILAVVSVLGALVMPLAASAGVNSPTSCLMKYDVDINDAACNCDKNNSVDIATCGMCCVMNTIYNVTDWIFMILVGIAAVMVLFGAFTLLTAGGAAEKVTTGRQYIIYAAVGLAVAFLAKAVPGVVKIIVGLQ